MIIVIEMVLMVKYRIVPILPEIPMIASVGLPLWNQVNADILIIELADILSITDDPL